MLDLDIGEDYVTAPPPEVLQSRQTVQQEVPVPATPESHEKAYFYL